MSEPTGTSLQSGALPAETLSNRLEELNRRIVSSMETAVREFHQDLSSFANETGSTAKRKTAGSILDAFARIDGEDSQSGILNALLDEGRRFASRTAFFLLRPDQVVAWGSRGFGEADNTLAGRTLAGGTPWTLLAEEGGSLPLDGDTCETICRQIGTEPGPEAILIPFIIRGQLGGALYADRVETSDQLLAEGLQLLTHTASQAVELVAVSHRGTSPALRRGKGSEDASKLPVWQPAAEGQPSETVEAPEPQTSTADTDAESATATAPDRTTDSVEDHDTSAPAPVVDALLGGTDESEPETASVLVEPEPLLEAPEPIVAEPEAQPTFAEPVAEPETAFAEPEAQPTFAEPVAEPEPTLAEPEAQPTFAEPVAEPETALAEPEAAPQEPEPAFETPEPSVFEPEIATPEFAAAAEPAPVEEIPVAPSATDFDSPEVGFDDEDQTAVDLSREIIPEPELEDTSTDIWSLEEEEDDDEPTMVGLSVDSASLASARGPQNDEPSNEPVPSDAVAADSVGQETVRLDIAALQGRAASFVGDEPAATTAQEPQIDMPEPQIEAPPSEAKPFEPPQPAPLPTPTSFAEPETAYVPPPVVASEEPAAVAPPPNFSDPVSSGGFVPPPPEPKPDAAAAVGASNEVRPPEGHQGPGLAFASAPGSDDALHEEARRLARLLVSEIKLYNEEIIEEGKRQGDIYGRLRDDIDRSRQMYQERIDPKLHGKDDYFYQELVQRLAGGDASLLGMS